MPIGPAPPIRVEPADGEPDRQRLATTSSWLAIAVHLRGEGRFRIATVVHGPRFISRRSATESAGFGVIHRSIPCGPSIDSGSTRDSNPDSGWTFQRNGSD